jgi:hypothetical protein
MFKMSKLLACLAIAIGFGLSLPDSALAQNSAGPQRAAGVKASGTPSVVESVTFNSSYEVKQIFVTTTAASLKVAVQDCCITGDQWGQRTYCSYNGGQWDVRGIGRGDTGSYTGETDVFKNGSQPIECVTELRYNNGVSVFPAGMSVKFTASGGGTVNTTILTTLVPLPSM